MTTKFARTISLEDGDLSLDLELESSAEGRKVYRMKRVVHAERGRLVGLPAQLFAPMVFRGNGKPIEIASGEPQDGQQRARGGWQVEGIASSTSQDWYGTEMDRDALEDMARQFSAGVALTPRHNSWFDAVEWDEVIGMTAEGTVRAAEVVNPAGENEQGYILGISASLYKEEDKAQTLYRRLEAEQPIGLSIGGWFTDVRVMTNEDDEVERIIVLKVNLDHLAVTRAPANPDSTGLKLLRGMAQSAVKLAIKRTVDTEPVAATESASTEPAPVATPATEPAVEPAVAAEPEPTKPTEALAADSPEPGNTSEIVDNPTPADNTDVTEDSAQADNFTPSTEESTMTPEQLSAILDSKLAPLVERVASIEGRAATAPAPAPVAAPTEPAVDWEARAKAAEQRVREVSTRGSGNRTTSIPNNGYAPGKGEGSQFRSLVQLARTEGRGIAVAAVSEANEAVLTADRYDPKVQREQLEIAMRSLINAGIADGIIPDPTNETAWK